MVFEKGKCRGCIELLRNKYWKYTRSGIINLFVADPCFFDVFFGNPEENRSRLGSYAKKSGSRQLSICT